MGAKRWLVSGAVAAVVLGAGGAAWAQEIEARHPKKEGALHEGGEENERLPVSVPERGITLGHMILSPGVDFDVAHISVGSASTTALGWGVGARMGITPDFDFRVTPVLLEDVPDAGEFNYVGPAFQATYRFLNIKHTFEMGGRVNAQFILLEATKGMILTPSLPMRIHLGKIAALDTGVEVPITVPFESGSTTAGLNVPVTFLIDVVEPVFHLGLGTGFTIADFDNAGDTVFIPLRFLAGVAIPGKNGPILDIDPFFAFPFFVAPGSNGDKIVSQFWQTGVAVEFYLYL